MRFRAVVPALGLAVVLGAACSSNDDPATVEAGGQTTAEETAEHNDADVKFAQMMIPHHEQAVEMAQLAATKADSEEVKDLASRIEAAQSPEIEGMTDWLAAWGEDVEPTSGMNHAGDSGMMTDAEMTELEAASGAEFDRMFLEMMVAHHTSAIEMAETEIADGQFPDAVALAEEIKSAQEAEIAEMESLLEQL
jgi:uncharacterized protein (DUF305 family)